MVSLLWRWRIGRSENLKHRELRAHWRFERAFFLSFSFSKKQLVGIYLTDPPLSSSGVVSCRMLL